MMLTEVLLQGARINPLIYETISTCWIFADEFFEANGWLTLYRESEYDDDFEDMANEFWGPELRYLREIFIHFRLGHTGLSQAWMPCFNSPVYNAVQRGYIKVYKLDKGKQFRSSQELSVASHPIWSQHLQSEYAEGSINQLRATLACALSESLDGRWYDRDVENRMLYNQGFGTRMAYRLGHTVKGAADSVVESLQELIHIGVVLFKGVQAGYRAYLELRHDIDEKGAAAITERMHALGIKIEQGVDKVTALLKQGLSMLNTILSDPYCRGYLFEYFDGLKESISELGRCRMIGGFIGEVGILFVLALATGGIGLIPRAAQLIGGLSYKVLKVMLKIYDALQAKAGQALEASRVAQRQLDLELNRSIAPVKVDNHKLELEKDVSDKSNEFDELVGYSKRNKEIPSKTNFDYLALVTGHPNAHSIERHGGNVTNEQLIHRALTGIAPDGHAKIVKGKTILPPMSSAFHTDELLIFADQTVRNKGALQAVIELNTGKSIITVKPADVGDLGLNIGRGFERIAGSKLKPELQGAPNLIENLRSVQATYEFNHTKQLWETITIFPAR
ncbi:MAG: hypothetical protein CMD81_14770 [Gammaproteobacteria bacterium]|nr:hypothetical protein [Gammaproteobacteria bacterium]